MRFLWMVLAGLLIAAPAQAGGESRGSVVRMFTGGFIGGDMFNKYPAMILKAIDGKWAQVDTGDENKAQLSKLCGYRTYVTRKESDVAFSLQSQGNDGKDEFRTVYTAMGGNQFAAAVDGAAMLNSLGMPNEGTSFLALTTLRGLYGPNEVFRPTPDILVLARMGGIAVYVRCP